MPASADKLHAVKVYGGQAPAEAQMSEHKVPMPVDVHAASALRTSAVSLHQIETAVKTEHLAAGNRSPHGRVGVVEPFQPRRNA